MRYIERGGRLHFLLGAGREEIVDLERDNLANGAEQQREIRKIWSTTLLSSWQNSKSWVGKMVRGCPSAGLKKKRKKARKSWPCSDVRAGQV